MTDVATIAAGLTKAQRAWVLLGREPSGMGKWPVHNALLDKGLANSMPWRWTPLGLAVRAHLREGKAS
jgi:hypothetical protein